MCHKDLFIPSIFLIYINNLTNHSVYCFTQLQADERLFFIAHNVKTLAGKLNPDLKANLNGHPSICHSIQIWIRLKKLYFHGKWQNHFTHKSASTLSANVLFEWKNEFLLPYLERNLQIHARSKVIAKCRLTFSHYARPHLEYDSYVYVKKKSGSQFYFSVYKFNVCYIRLENLV